ncbi:GNAT family N-acetyltransferase [Micromonospora sp. NPDC050397]|uniref:GNAT family N-acetyltransferase n=1 Tax=Micromonospora sp. NPDC050397 TaxID=3364279 RepID=UPI00384DC90F
MTASTPIPTFDRLNATELHQYRDELLAVYTEVYAEQLDTPFFSVPRYWDRLVAYASRDGFSAVVGRLDNQLIGYALGYTLPPGSRWWSGLRDDVDPALLVEDGRRTFALNEIMVREAFRRRGYARQLHDALLAGRSEERATLLVLPNNAPARSAYLSWNWYGLGELQPFNDAPVYDAMLLDLE